MIAEYKINVGDGKQITASGDVDKLDEMCERLQAYDKLIARIDEMEAENEILTSSLARVTSSYEAMVRQASEN